MPDQHGRLVTVQAVEDDRRVVLEARGGVLERQDGGQAFVAAPFEFGDQWLPARFVMPGTMNRQNVPTTASPHGGGLPHPA